MRGVAVLFLQVVVSVLVVASALPALLAKVPAARDGWIGPGLAVGAMAAIFVLLRVLWPQQRHD